MTDTCPTYATLILTVAHILDAASELLYRDWHGFECRDHLRKLAEELNNYANPQ